jgi:hypothetical protein
LESKCRQCGTHRALPLCDRCVLCVKLISCLFRNISPLPIAKSLHGVSQTTEVWLKADVFHATGATVAKVGSKNSARFVLACSRKARPSGPPTVATTRPSQGLVCTRLLCLGLSRGPRPFRDSAGSCGTGYAVPPGTRRSASGAALRVTLSRDLLSVDPPGSDILRPAGLRTSRPSGLE